MNIKLVSILLTVVFIASCGGATQLQIDDAATKISVESPRCDSEITNLSWSLCIEEVYRKHMPSDYFGWSSLNTLLYKRNVLAANADKQDMSKDDFNSKLASLDKEFKVSEQKELQALKEQSKAIGNALQAAGSAAQSLSTKFGFLTGQTISGFNKICTYSVGVSIMTTNISSTSICPQTHRF
jgi:hypothetical protein